MPRTTICLLVALLALLAGADRPALAREKTDVVILDNGDRLHGEIKKLEFGRLRVKTADIDTVYIEWAAIAVVTTEFFYEIETQEGQRFYGSLGIPEQADTIRIVLMESFVDLPMPDVVKIEPIRATFWKRIDGSLSLGFNYTKSSDIGTLSLTADATHRARKFRNDLYLNSIFTAKSDQPDSSRFDLGYGYLRYLKKRYAAGGSVALQSNDELGLDLRFIVSGYVARNTIQTNRSLLIVKTGLAVNREWREIDPPTTNLEAVLTTDYSFFQYKYPKADINVELNVFPGITDWGRVRVEFSSRFRREMVTDFTLNLDPYVSYDNRPAEEASGTDWGIILGVGWTF